MVMSSFLAERDDRFFSSDVVAQILYGRTHED